MPPAAEDTMVEFNNGGFGKENGASGANRPRTRGGGAAKPGEDSWHTMRRRAQENTLRSLPEWVAFFSRKEATTASSDEWHEWLGMATSSMPCDTYRDDETYINIWLTYAHLKRELESDDEAGQTFRYMKLNGIGKRSAGFYLAWAQFEADLGKKSKARQHLEEGLKSQTADAPLLKNALSALDRETKPTLDARTHDFTRLVQSLPQLAAPHTRSTVAAGQAPTRRSTRTSAASSSPDEPAGADDTQVIVNTNKSGRQVQGDNDHTEVVVKKRNTRSRKVLDKTETETQPPISKKDILALPTFAELQAKRKAASPSPARAPAATSKPAPTKKLRFRSDVPMRVTKEEQEAAAPEVFANPSKPEFVPPARPSHSQYPPPPPHQSHHHAPSTPTSAPHTPHTPAPVYAPPMSDDESIDSDYSPAPAAHATPTAWTPQRHPHDCSQHHHQQYAPPPHQQYAPPPSPVSALHQFTDMLTVNGKTYVKLEVVGKGGSSKVFRVLEPTTKTLYAVKKIRLPSTDPKVAEPFVNEIALMERLRGRDNIIQLIDSEVNLPARTIYMVMTMGETDLAHVLQKRKKEKARPDENFIRLTWQQMLEAVDTIHQERIVHGDLKPANFLFVNGVLKLIDFGIAKAIVGNDTTKIVRDSQIGTLNYMAPEAILDSNQMYGTPIKGGEDSKQEFKLGRASDIWSLGCILYQMVYGSPPFQALGMIQKIQAITDEKYKIDFPPLRNSSLRDCIQQCLVRNPPERISIQQLFDHPFLKPNKCTRIHVNRELLFNIIDYAMKATTRENPPSASELSDIIYTKLETQARKKALNLHESSTVDKASRPASSFSASSSSASTSSSGTSSAGPSTSAPPPPPAPAPPPPAAAPPPPSSAQQQHRPSSHLDSIRQRPSLRRAADRAPAQPLSSSSNIPSANDLVSASKRLRQVDVDAKRVTRARTETGVHAALYSRMATMRQASAGQDDTLNQVSWQ